MNWGEAQSRAETLLSKAEIPSAKQDARMLLAFHLDVTTSVAMAFPERPLPQEENFFALIDRRLKFEPVSHILGEREFWSLPFYVTKDVLDPRPDSETLVEAVLGCLTDIKKVYNFVDFGTGSGCLLLSLLSEYENAQGLGVDISEAAIKIAQKNTKRLGLGNRSQFLLSHWEEKVTGKFDLLLSNPPYITSADMETLSPDVYNHEPHIALHGGDDGLGPYRHLIPAGNKLLQKGGLIAFEFGYQQADDVAALLETNGYQDIEFIPDLSGIIRCITAKRG